MFKKLLTTSALLVFTLASAPQAFASTSGILGQVTCNGTPVYGAAVEAENSSGKLFKLTTDRIGFYMFNLDPGNYFVGVTYNPGCPSPLIFVPVTVNPYFYTWQNFSF